MAKRSRRPKGNNRFRPQGAVGQPKAALPPGLNTGRRVLMDQGSKATGKNGEVDSRFVQSARAWFLDPYIYGNWRGQEGKPGISWDSLRRMAETCEPVVAIHKTRQNQVAAFSRKAHDDQTPGWRIVLKDPDKQPTAADENRIAEVEYFFEHMHCQVPDKIHSGLRSGPGLDYPELNFDGFLRKLVLDRLTMDAVVMWKKRLRDGTLLSTHLVDPSTIQRTFPKESMGGDAYGVAGAVAWLDDAEKRSQGDYEEIRYVQKVHGQEVSYFTEREMAYAYANPRSDIRYAGYGQSELEVMISTVTGLLFAMRYNLNNFTNNSIPEGLLVLFGMFDPEVIEGFKREFEAKAAGVENSHRLPIITANPGSEGQGRGGAEWVAMRMANREMQYAEWMNFLVNLACAIYQINPEEINFKGFGGPDQVISQRGPDSELKHSKDKGLRPLLEWTATLLTDQIVAEFYDDMCFEFVNYDVTDEKTKLENAKMRIDAGISTANEERAKMDMDKIDEEWADAPGNPTLMQVYMSDKQMEQQKEMMAQQQQQQGQMDDVEADEDAAAADEEGWKRFLYEKPEEEPDEPTPEGQDVQKSMPRDNEEVLAASRLFKGWE